MKLNINSVICFHDSKHFLTYIIITKKKKKKVRILQCENQNAKLVQSIANSESGKATI